jgi:hypothetical protein
MVMLETVSDDASVGSGTAADKLSLAFKAVWGRRAVAQHRGIRMQPKEGSGKTRGHLRLNQAFECLALGFTADKQQDFSRVQDLAQPERHPETRFNLEIFQQAMGSRGAGQARDMCVGLQGLSWLIHGDMAVGAQPKYAKIDWAVDRKPIRHTVAFGLGIGRIADEPGVSAGRDTQRIQQLCLQVSLARRWTGSSQAHPFIDLQDPQPGEQGGPARALRGQLSVSAGRCAARGSAQEQPRTPPQLGNDELRRPSAQGLVIFRDQKPQCMGQRCSAHRIAIMHLEPGEATLILAPLSALPEHPPQ